MDKIIIEGPCKLSGSVKVSCAKNAYLPIIAATLLNPNIVELQELPQLKDIRTINKLLENLGVKIHVAENKSYFYNAKNILNREATYDLVKTMRASILVLGPLLARFGEAKVSLPGGCAIGARPINIHLENLEKMGAKISIENGYVRASAKKLKGSKLVLSFPSVGATENLMMAAVLAEGKTTIENAALEPEIEDLGNFLKKMGVIVTGLNTSSIVIEGTSIDNLRTCDYRAIGDRIEAMTYIIAGLITDSEIEVTGVRTLFIDSALDILKNMGAKLLILEDSVKTFSSKLVSSEIETSPYPGFPTDAQAQIMALATQAEGVTLITEKIFENRFMHAPELRRLGASIKLKGNVAIVKGKTKLLGAPVMCTDLRASAALVLAGLCGYGTTEIQRVYHLDRGYESLDNKLKTLGAKINRINQN